MVLIAPDCLGGGRGGLVAAAAVGLVAGCFSPSPPDGQPCGLDGACPPGQSCYTVDGQDQVCLSDSPADASVVPPRDASPPAYDASVAVDADPGRARFGTPEVVALRFDGSCPDCAMADPHLTEDGTQLYISSRGDTGDNGIYRSERFKTGAWADLVRVTPLNLAGAELSPFVAQYSRQIWFSRDNFAGNGYGAIEVASYDMETDDWGTPVAATEFNTPTNERSPSVRVIEGVEVILFTRARMSYADHDVYYSARNGLVSPPPAWPAPKALNGLNQADQNEHSVFLAADGTVYVIRDNLIYWATYAWSSSKRDGPILQSKTHLDELDTTTASGDVDQKRGLWVSDDGREIWFGSERDSQNDTDDLGLMRIYRASMN